MHLVKEAWLKAGSRPPVGVRPAPRLHGWVARSLRQCRRQAVGTQQQLLSSSLEPQDCVQAFQPSPHLRELVSQQLRFIFTTGSFQAGLTAARATVYARCSSLLPGPDLQLQRVASWPPRASRPAWMSSSSLTAGGAQDLISTMEEDDLLLLASSAWGPPGEGGGASAEASLLGEEVLLLPNSATLVLPLASQGVLVGLLVVEGTAAAAAAAAAAAGRVPVPQPPPGSPPLAPVSLLSSFDGSVWDEDPALPSTSSPSSEPGPASTTPSVAAACVGLTEQQLDALRCAVPMLAAAAALDMRSALAGAAAAASAAKAASLLSEARGPLRAISTFGRMLVPRLEEGAPDRDMAAGIMTQELRLQEVLGALEAALRPTSSSWAGQGMPAAMRAGGEAASIGQPPQWQQLSPGWPDGQPSWEGSSIGGSAWPALEGAGDTWGVPPGDWLPMLEQQQTEGAQPTGVPPENVEGEALSAATTAAAAAAATAAAAAAEHAQAAAEQAASAASCTPAEVPATATAGGAAIPAAPDAVWGPELPAALRASARDIRWSPSSRSRGADVPLNQPRRSGPIAAAVEVTLDVTTSTSAADSSVAPAGVATSSSGGAGITQSPAPGAGEAQPTPSTADSQLATTSRGASSEGECCDLVEVVQHVLRAAAKLAAVQGVHLIVNHPLQTPDTDHTHAQHSRGQPAAPGVAVGGAVEAGSDAEGLLQSVSSSTSSSEEEQEVGPDLGQLAQAGDSSSSGWQQAAPLPPPPPLLVGARPQVVQRSLGYVLDVALQCTPPGGQLVVTARQCSSGVELCVLHTGQLHPRRLHPSSRAMAAALPGPAGEGALGEQLGSSRLAGRVDGLVSLTFAQQLLQGVGGRINLVHPHHFMNASSGQLEVGTSVEVWLPRPAPPSE